MISTGDEMFKEEELRLAQEAAGLAVWEWILETDELRWQPGSVPLFGRPIEELNSGEKFFQCVLPDDRERLRKRLEASLNSGEDYRVEFRVHFPDGQIRWLIGNGRVMQDEERGRVLVGVDRDITEDKSRESKLRAQARLLELAYEPILARDEQDRIVYWNRGAERLYGYTWQEASGRKTHDLLHTQFPKSLGEIEAQLVETGHWEGELIHLTKGGRYVHVASRWQKLDEGENAVLESNFDLSQQRALEIARTWEQKANLIAKLAHEINNPLEAASGATHILKSSCSDGTNQRYVEVLEQSIRRIADFIRESNEIHKRARLDELAASEQDSGHFGPM